jgi:hypothetical protein
MTDKNLSSQDQGETNLDPISGKPGAHPIGTGLGAAGAGSFATVIGGVVGGPVGAVVGAVVGSVVGGLAGKGTAEIINPTLEDNLWRKNYATRPYVDQGLRFEEYQLAYRLGYQSYSRYGHTGEKFEQVELQLEREYEIASKDSGVEWNKAKYAVKNAWWDCAAKSLRE